MKFSQIPYKRPSFEEMESTLNGLLERFKNASSVDEAVGVYKEYDDYTNDIDDTATIAFIRNSMDTNDEFYDGEVEYWDETEPMLEEIMQEFTKALLTSKYRAELEEKWGSLLFVNAEIDLKTFNSEIVSDLQEENALSTKYDKLKASAQIEFDGKTLTLEEFQPYFENPDRNIRKAAQAAHDEWFLSNSDKLEDIFDKMVKVRTTIAEKLGYENFVELGYYRMTRNCYDKDMVAKFREGVLKHIVPIVVKLKKQQANRIGVETIKPYDQDFFYPDGNAKPVGTEDDTVNHGRKMYHELSNETRELIDFMLENELFDILTRPGKSSGGYCSMMPKIKYPFIFANFNGTSGDVDVFTHEVGHALAFYTAKDIFPTAMQYAPEETSEIHSMAMEFFTWPWMEGFFGDKTERYYDSHLSGALTFLPYGVMVDEFQHLIYENPDMTPKERNECWARLEAKYRPWLDMKEVPFYSDGRRWQRQLHIYTDPFYYIDYCLAGIIALCFWAEIQKDSKLAWEKYMRLLSFAGTKTFVEIIKDVGLPTPFEPDNIKAIADIATAWLNSKG